jgi:MFS family permease
VGQDTRSTFQLADNLRSRTFIGLLIAQFLAAFNDQAIHASAMFFAINHDAMSQAGAISLMPILFYAPWALFSTIAGYLADKYSKKNSLVFWKLAEVVITAVALLGFWLGTRGNAAGPWVVLSTVFLMGMHSAFFVPAKYGVMPEILQSHMLSRANGVLESLSFLAIILGTVFGGVLSYYFHGREYIIGIVLVVLAIIGAGASFLIQTMPAANPQRRFPFLIFGPLYQNVKELLRSRPLAFAVVGIAFFTFIVGFMRATVYMHGESQMERWSELKTSLVVGMVALGIGMGSPLVGYLSGGKVELGLIPIGALGMMLATVLASVLLGWIPGLIVCIIAIGFFTGFYIVPLFTLLQHRAPKVSKGDSIATSNMINVIGAILASVVFFGLDTLARKTGFAPELKQEPYLESTLAAPPVYEGGRLTGLDFPPDVRDPLAIGGGAGNSEPHYEVVGETIEMVTNPFKERLKEGDKVIITTYHRGKKIHYRVRREGEPLSPVYDEHALPQLLFLSAGGMTLLTLIILWIQLPSLFTRTFLWMRWRGKTKLEVYGMHHMPDRGPVVLVTSNARRETCLQILSATDRTTEFLLLNDVALPRLVSEPQRETEKGLRALRAGNAVALSLPLVSPSGNSPPPVESLNGLQAPAKLTESTPGGIPELHSPVLVQAVEELFTVLTSEVRCPILPVFTDIRLPAPGHYFQTVDIVVGEPLPAGASVRSVREAIARLAEEVQQRLASGIPIEEESRVGLH